MNEQVEGKKIVLLQKEEMIEKGGIRFRVIASGDPNEGFEYAIEGPDGETVTASPGFLSLDGALESGIAAAKRINPDWYKELKEAEKEGSDFDEENYSAEELLIRTKNRIVTEYVRIGELIGWLDGKEDALHVSPEWESIKGALELSREAYAKLRAAAGSIDIGLDFIREDFSGSDFNTSSRGDKFESEKDETLVEPEICPECNGDGSYHDASGSKMIQCPKCKGNGILVIELR